jgi:hypothetical protein
VRAPEIDPIGPRQVEPVERQHRLRPVRERYLDEPGQESSADRRKKRRRPQQPQTDIPGTRIDVQA